MIRIAMVFMFMIVVSIWIVLPLSAGAGSDQFAQHHPTTDYKNKKPSPNLQSPHSATSAPKGAPAVKSASSSSSQKQSAKPSTHVASRSPSGGDKSSQPSKASVDPAKTSTAGTSTKTGGATAGSGATGSESYHHRTAGASSEPGPTGPETHHHHTPGTLPPGNMIAGGDEQAMAEAVAAATTTGAEGPDKEIRDLENRAAASRQLANQFARAADDMLANFRNKNGDITKEDIDKMKTFATAGGYTSQAFLNSPPEVQAKGHQFEGRFGLLNLIQAANLAPVISVWC